MRTPKPALFLRSSCFFSFFGQDRDGVIAAVEDARAAQEREAEHLRDKLRGLGKLLSPPRELNSKAGIANGNGHVRGNGAWGGADSRGEGAQDQLAEGEEVSGMSAATLSP